MRTSLQPEGKFRSVLPLRGECTFQPITFKAHFVSLARFTFDCAVDAEYGLKLELPRGR